MNQILLILFFNYFFLILPASTKPQALNIVLSKVWLQQHLLLLLYDTVNSTTWTTDAAQCSI